MEAITVIRKEKQTPGEQTAKAIIAININTGEQKIYSSAVAAEKNGFTAKTISMICNGLNRTHNGHAFRFAKPEETELEKS